MAHETISGAGVNAEQARSAAMRRRASASDIANSIVYALVFATTVALVTVPLAALLYGSVRTSAPGLPGEWTLQNLVGLTTPGVVGVMVQTLIIGVVTAVISVALGTLIALIVHRTDFKYPNLMTALVGLAFYFPSFILAMAWIIIGSPGGIINNVLGDIFGLPGQGRYLHDRRHRLRDGAASGAVRVSYHARAHHRHGRYLRGSRPHVRCDADAGAAQG